MPVAPLVACIVLASAIGAPVPKKASSPPGKSAVANKQAPARKSPSATKQAPAGKSTAAAGKRPSPSRKSASRSKSKRRLPSWRTSQQVPTRERYLEIQQALVSRGFLQGPPTGVWGPDSVAALKKFQASQDLDPTGKLDSLSLIALGLGPRREADGARPPSLSEPKQP